MSKQTRMKPAARKEDILKAALSLAEGYGYTQLTRKQVGAAAGVSGTAVQYHFSTMPKFRRELMRYAVKQRNAVVVAQGLAVRDPQALKADEDLRHAARRAIS